MKAQRLTFKAFWAIIGRKRNGFIFHFILFTYCLYFFRPVVAQIYKRVSSKGCEFNFYSKK